MRTFKLFSSALISILLFPAIMFAQAFGEYGKTVGSVPHGKTVTGNKGSGATSQGTSRGGKVQQVEQLPVRALPSRLVVTAGEASLYPRQDEEAQRLDQLTQGESLTPMMQSAGGNEWFMVKTQKGAVGWVRSVDVREEKATK